MDKVQSLGRTITVSTLEGMPIPEREWIVDGWVPVGSVTAIYGDGGTGKSLLAMQLLTCCTIGKDFLGLPTQKTVAFGYFCEDSENELHIRQTNINRRYGIEFLQLDNLHWQSRIGNDNVLMKFSHDGVGAPTNAYDQLREEVLRSGARVVVIDTAADTFGGNEIMRAQVRQFINLLSSLASEINGAVILCAHPSVAGLLSGEGTGGSIAWSNTVRSRIYLTKVSAKDDDYSDSEARDLRELTKKKANYGSTGETFLLRWKEGVFESEQGRQGDIVSELARKQQNKEDAENFLRRLDKLTAQGRNVSESKNARNYAPKIMRGMIDETPVSLSRLESAMEWLFASNKIEVGDVGRRADRKQKQGIRRRLSNEHSEVQHGSY